MVWHIFKKDWKLIWTFVVAVALLHWLAAVVLHKLSVFPENPMLGMLEETLPMLGYFGSAFLIAAIVHLDVLTGIRQDWLVRPISRKVLLVEKFLFIVVMVETPILLANLFQGLSNGFSFSASLLPALSKVSYLLFVLILPIFALASVSRNLTQAFIFGCGCAVIITTFQQIVDDSSRQTHGTLIPVTWSGIGWVGELVRIVLVILAVSVILGLQYFRRKTVPSRILLVTFGLLLLFSEFLPWTPAFAIQRRLSANPLAGANAFVDFDNGAGKFRLPSGLSAVTEAKYFRGRATQPENEVFLPLRVSGIPVGSVLLTDRVEVRLIRPGAGTVYHGTGETLEIRREGSSLVSTPSYQGVEIPAAVYRSIKDQPLRLELEYSLTLFTLSNSYSVPAIGGDERMPGWGWCQTRMNDIGTVIEMRCMQPGKGPTCGTVFLQNTVTGQRNPERSVCSPDYSPYSGRFGQDDMARFGVNLPFRDATGLAHFPVDGPQLPQSRIIIRSYEPQDHFVRSLVIPEIKLQDWEPQ